MKTMSKYQQQDAVNSLVWYSGTYNYCPSWLNLLRTMRQLHLRVVIAEHGRLP